MSSGRRALDLRALVRLGLRATGAALLLGMTLFAFEWWRLPSLDELMRAAVASTVLEDRSGEPIRYRLAADDTLAPRVALSQISRHVGEATIAAEDARFRSHRGVDPLAVCRALWINVTSGRIVSGASTITMQVARLLRPLPRGYYGKFREAVLAIWLERLLSKDRILEFHLNLSPYGSNLRGVEAAARRYFGRSSADLSFSESALLAGLPQSPSRLRPDRHPHRARARRDWILDRMACLRTIDTGRCAIAKETAVNAKFEPLPRAAPHFTQWAIVRCRPGERVRTTLDRHVQGIANDAVRDRVEELAALGVRNGAAFVVETRSGKIRAYVGSQDFHDRRDGQVNGIVVRRSPGSLLKPFIYAFAFETAIAGPDTILHDVPARYRDGYDPRNYSRRFHGRVSARDALVRSLNVPAVDLLSRVGVAATLPRLRDVGFRSIQKSADHYGLALGLGGVDVTLLELAEAYATLGRLGKHRPLTFREDSRSAPLRRVLDSRAAYDVADILEGAAWTDSERAS